MTGFGGDELRAVAAEIAEHQAKADALGKQLTEMTVTVTAPSRSVSVTVNGLGAVTSVGFPTKTYRTMAPAELGDLITRTIEKARAEGLAKAEAEAAIPTVPGFSHTDSMSGKVDLKAMLAPVLAEFGDALANWPAPVQEKDSHGR
nr:YbaB/EbfC family nucleoid-associated protein [Kibdelosporangium sp. MJ126-NF4]CEL16306.1 hypothetical protein [Kibdelosporangium sp. MJ126-NF4]CTQ94230.1 hypothetical protein [Kibdelosporangium sp. MJ126-NF4]